MPTSKVHGYRASYSAPVTQKVGAKRPKESLREFLARIRRMENDILITNTAKYLIDLPPNEWAEYVANLWEETQ
jgi:hypothetical protein